MKNIRFFDLIVFFISLIPYSFISLYLDGITGSVVGYFILAFIFFILFYCIKDDKNSYFFRSYRLLIPSIISGFISYFLAGKYLGYEYNYYFAPFTSRQLVIFISILFILMQINFKFLKK